MTPLRIVLLLQLLFFVAGCQQSSDTKTFTTSTPTALTRISNSILSVKMTIDGALQYDGRLQADGTWVVRPQGLELGVDHTVVNEWYGQYEGENYLLMRQQGSFFADPDTMQAVLNLPAVSSGAAEFDFDCDNLTNIDEFIAGSNPNTLPGCETPPETTPVTPSGTTLEAWVAHDFQEFVQSGYILPVKFVDQQMLITSFDANKGMSFGMTLHTNLNQAAADDRLSVALAENAQGNRTAEISMILPLGLQAATGGSCYNGIDNPERLVCGIPFDWQLDHWYTLRVAESPESALGFSFWDGWLIDQQTGENFLLGSVLTPDTFVMQKASIGINYYEPHDQTECTEGLPSSTISYLSSTVNNNDFTAMPLTLNAGPCAENGGGWSFDDAMINAENKRVFSLTLGQ